MQFKQRTLDRIADMICGNFEPNKPDKTYFPYRTSSSITRFFQDADTEYYHNGSTRAVWVAGVLEEILNEPQADPHTPPDSFIRVIATLMDRADAHNESTDRSNALATLNKELNRENLEAFYADDGVCYLRHIKTKTVIGIQSNPHRPFSKVEQERRERLKNFLNNASEDELIEEILLPLFRQLGFHRISSAGHKDKALEYGKDIWMRYVLPTQHSIYFGVQVKKGKLDASGVSKATNTNIAEILNQAMMMLGHVVFDPEIGKRVLVDHAYIVAGGEITKSARNWLGEKLDATKRSQLIFMDREDILNLFVVSNLPLPKNAQIQNENSDDIPF